MKFLVVLASIGALCLSSVDALALRKSHRPLQKIACEDDSEDCYAAIQKCFDIDDNAERSLCWDKFAE